MGLALATFTAGEALAGSANLRNTAPGRRIGGGTRGECTARLIAHLVPSSGAGLTLVTVPAFQGPTVWETASRCEDAPAPVSASTDLDCVTTDAPPALSPLVTEAGSEDAALQRSLKELRSACGSIVDRATVAKAFGLTDLRRRTGRHGFRFAVRAEGCSQRLPPLQAFLTTLERHPAPAPSQRRARPGGSMGSLQPGRVRMRRESSPAHRSSSAASRWAWIVAEALAQAVFEPASMAAASKAGSMLAAAGSACRSS